MTFADPGKRIKVEPVPQKAPAPATPQPEKTPEKEPQKV